jgi:hypothetical protein
MQIQLKCPCNKREDQVLRSKTFGFSSVATERPPKWPKKILQSSHQKSFQAAIEKLK